MTDQILKNTQDISEIKGTLKGLEVVIKYNSEVMKEFKDTYKEESKENRKFMNDLRQHLEKSHGLEKQVLMVQNDVNEHKKEDQIFHDHISDSFSTHKTETAVEFTGIKSDLKTLMRNWTIFIAVVSFILNKFL